MYEEDLASNVARNTQVWRRGLLVLLAALTMSFTPFEVSPDTAALPSSSLHDPIVIDSDNNLTAANGVVGGSGTLADPFRIEGWRIPVRVGPAVSVSNTVSHVVIRECILEFDSESSETGYPIGLLLINVTNFSVLEVACIGPLQAGVRVYASRNVTVEGCIMEFSNGISIHGHSASVRISDNTLDSGDIWVYQSAGVSISGNVLRGSRGNIEIVYSTDIAVTSNNLTDGTIDIDGTKLEQYSTVDVTDSNLVNGLPVLVVKDQSHLTLDASGYGQVICVNLSDSRVTDFESTALVADRYSSFRHIQIVFSEDINVSGCEMSGGSFGVHARYCTDTTVVGCAFDSVSEGVMFGNCQNCTVTDCLFTEFTEIGGNGVNMGTSERIFVIGNSFLGGGGVYVYNTSDSTIFWNTFRTRFDSIRLEKARDILVYHNNFMEGFVSVDGDCASLEFDSGPVVGGNHWGMLTRQDKDGDGFGDEPVTIGDFQDRYPLMEPIVHDSSSGDGLLLLLASIMILIAGSILLIAVVLLIPRKRPPNDV
jgi:nitrous oxidase accessory protein NosD